jgi:hypothetical protein
MELMIYDNALVFCFAVHEDISPSQCLGSHKRQVLVSKLFTKGTICQVEASMPLIWPFLIALIRIMILILESSTDRCAYVCAQLSTS